jgi:hypothetical protein
MTSVGTILSMKVRSFFKLDYEWGEVKDRKNKERQNKKDPNMLIVIHHAESDVEQASK